MEKLISWVEVPASNIERAVGFYNSVLNLDLQINDFGFEKMAFFPGGEGAISYSEEIKPGTNGLLVSFNAGDYLDEAIEKVQHCGGELIKPKTKIEAEGMRYFALVMDSEGNKIGLYGNA